MPLDIIGIIVVGLIVIGVIVISYMRTLQRRKALLEWAAPNGLAFDYHRDSSIDETYSAFKCLRQGHSRYAYNHLTGSWNGYPFHGFDYHYAVGGGKHTRHYYFSVVILALPHSFKELLIRPEKAFDKVTEFFGLDDIDFESIEFSKRFYVKASDKKWAYDLLHQRAMDYLLNSQNYSIQFYSNEAIVYQNIIFEPSEFGVAADHIIGLLNLLPDYVKENLK